MKIDKLMYNKKGYLFEGIYSTSVKFWFDLIHNIFFIGNPPYYTVGMAYTFRKFILWFYKKHNKV